VFYEDKFLPAGGILAGARFLARATLEPSSTGSWRSSIGRRRDAPPSRMPAFLCSA
jgi:hypothetical protein